MLAPQSAHTHESICPQFISGISAVNNKAKIVQKITVGGHVFTYTGCRG